MATYSNLNPVYAAGDNGNYVYVQNEPATTTTYWYAAPNYGYTTAMPSMPVIVNDSGTTITHVIEQDRQNTGSSQQIPAFATHEVFESEAQPSKSSTSVVKVKTKKQSPRSRPNKIYYCPVCGLPFANSSNLKSHGRIHTGEKPYKCDLCDKAFIQSSNLKCHRRIHTGERPYLCRDCGDDFSRSSHLRSHQKRMHGEKRPYVCTACPKGHSNVQEMVKHMKRHPEDTPVKCVYCEDNFSTCETLETHLKIHEGDRPYLCGKCSQTFARIWEMKEHKKSHVNEDEIEEGDKYYPCYKCSKRSKRKFCCGEERMLIEWDEPRFTPRKYAQQEVEKENQKQKLKEMLYIKKEEEKNTLKSLIQAPKANNVTMFVQKKGKLYVTTNKKKPMFIIDGFGNYEVKCIPKNKHSRELLKKEYHFDDEDIPGSIEIDEDATDRAMGTLIEAAKKAETIKIKKRKKDPKPTRIKKPDTRKEESLARVPPEKLFICNTCGVPFANSSNLKNHVRTHTGERPYACDLCPKAFVQSSNLKAHKRIHTGERPFACVLCTKSFMRSSHLKSHMERKHEQY